MWLCGLAGWGRGFFHMSGGQVCTCSSICMNSRHMYPLLPQMEHMCTSSPAVHTSGDLRMLAHHFCGLVPNGSRPSSALWSVELGTSGLEMTLHVDQRNYYIIVGGTPLPQIVGYDFCCCCLQKCHC